MVNVHLAESLLRATGKSAVIRATSVFRLKLANSLGLMTRDKHMSSVI